MYTNNTRQQQGDNKKTGLILKLFSLMFPNWRTGDPFPFWVPLWAHGPCWRACPCLRAEYRMIEGLLLSLTSFFQCGKFYLGLGDFNLCTNSLVFCVFCVFFFGQSAWRKWTHQHLYSYPFGGRELDKHRRTVRSLITHLAPLIIWSWAKAAGSGN